MPTSVAGFISYHKSKVLYQFFYGDVGTYLCSKVSVGLPNRCQWKIPQDYVIDQNSYKRNNIMVCTFAMCRRLAKWLVAHQESLCLPSFIKISLQLFLFPIITRVSQASFNAVFKIYIYFLSFFIVIIILLYETGPISGIHSQCSGYWLPGALAPRHR